MAQLRASGAEALHARELGEALPRQATASSALLLFGRPPRLADDEPPAPWRAGRRGMNVLFVTEAACATEHHVDEVLCEFDRVARLGVAVVQRRRPIIELWIPLSGAAIRDWNGDLDQREAHSLACALLKYIPARTLAEPIVAASWRDLLARTRCGPWDTLALIAPPTGWLDRRRLARSGWRCL